MVLVNCFDGIPKHVTSEFPVRKHLTQQGPSSQQHRGKLIRRRPILNQNILILDPLKIRSSKILRTPCNLTSFAMRLSECGTPFFANSADDHNRGAS
jgi:hypothetical protein